MATLKVYEVKFYDKEAHLEKSIRVEDFTLKSAITFARFFIHRLNQSNFDNTDAKNKRRYCLRRVMLLYKY